MLMGTLSITRGKALVLGVDVQIDPVQIKQRVGYVPETHHIYRWMRVREVIGFCKSCFPTWNDKLCREMLKLFGLDPEKKVKHLSKGMLVKLSLLVAVSHEPELLLLDEPLSGLDPIAREEFLDGVLRTICDRGQTVLISSHMLDDVRRLADTIGILNNGRLIVQGNVDQLLTSTKRICATLRDGARPTGRRRASSGSASKAASGRSPSAISRRRRFSRSRRSPASKMPASSTSGWRISSRTSFEGKRWHDELASLERLSSEPTSRLCGDPLHGRAPRVCRWGRMLGMYITELGMLLSGSTIFSAATLYGIVLAQLSDRRDRGQCICGRARRPFGRLSGFLADFARQNPCRQAAILPDRDPHNLVDRPAARNVPAGFATCHVSTISYRWYLGDYRLHGDHLDCGLLCRLVSVIVPFEHHVR